MILVNGYALVNEKNFISSLLFTIPSSHYFKTRSKTGKATEEFIKRKFQTG
jgi:hypothetical protein